MYPNIRAELVRKGKTLTELAEYLGISLGTLSAKMNGKFDFTFLEAVNTKRFLAVDIPLEVLFERVAA